MRALLVGGPAHGTFMEIAEVIPRLYVPAPAQSTIGQYGGDLVNPVTDFPEVIEYTRVRLQRPPGIQPRFEVYAAPDEKLTLAAIGDAHRTAQARARAERERAARAEMLVSERRSWDALRIVDGRDVPGLAPEMYRREDLSDGTVIYRPERMRP